MVVTCGICQSEFDNDLIFTDHFLRSHLSDKTDDDEKPASQDEGRKEKYPELFKDVHEISTAENEQKNLPKNATIVENPQIILHKSDTDYLKTLLSSGKVFSGRTVKIKFLPPPQHEENKILNTAVTESNYKSDLVIKNDNYKFCNSISDQINGKKITVNRKNLKKKISEKNISSSNYSDIFTNACDICGGIFADAHKLANHIITHVGAMPYYCSLCSFSCISKLRLKQHIIGHFVPDKQNREKIFKENCSIFSDLLHGCDKCDSHYISWSELVIHSLKHIINMPYKCQGCQMFFSDYKDFSIHNHIHKDSTVCDICKIYFNSRIRLLDHVLEHNKSKFFRKFRHIGWNDGLKSLPDTFSVLIEAALCFSNNAVNNEMENKVRNHTLESEESFHFENSEDIQHLCEVIFQEIPKDDKIFSDFNDKFNKNIKSNSHCVSAASKSFLESMKNYMDKRKKGENETTRIKRLSNSIINALNCEEKNEESSNSKLVKGHSEKKNASATVGNINKFSDSKKSTCKKIVFKKNKKSAKLLHSRGKLNNNIGKEKNSKLDVKKRSLTEHPESKEDNIRDLHLESVNGENSSVLSEKADNDNSCERAKENQSHDERGYMKRLVVVLEKLPVEVHDLKSFRRYKDKLRYKLKQAKIQEKKRKKRLQSAKRRMERLRLAVTEPKNDGFSSKNPETNNDVPFTVDSKNGSKENIKRSLRSFKGKLDKQKNNSELKAVVPKKEIKKLESSEVKKTDNPICSVPVVLREDEEIALKHASTQINDINPVKDIDDPQLTLESKNSFVRNKKTLSSSIKSIKRKCKKKHKSSVEGITSKKKRMEVASSQKNCVNSFKNDLHQIPPNLSTNSDNRNKCETLLHGSKKSIQYSSSDSPSSSEMSESSESDSSSEISDSSESDINKREILPLSKNENITNNSVACDIVVKSCEKESNPTDVNDTSAIKTGLDISKNKVKKLQADVIEKNVNEQQTWLKNQREIIRFDHCYFVNDQNNLISNNSLKKHSSSLKLKTVKKKLCHKKTVSKNMPKKLNFFQKSKSRCKNNIDQKSKIKSLRVLRSIAKYQTVRVKLAKLPDYIYEKHLRQKPIMLSNILPIISNVESVSSENVLESHNYDFLMDHNYSNYTFSSNKDFNHHESDTESTLSSYSNT